MGYLRSIKLALAAVLVGAMTLLPVVPASAAPQISSGSLVGVAVPGTLSTFSHEWTWNGPNATADFSAAYRVPEGLVVDEDIADIRFEYAGDGINFVTVTDEEYVMCGVPVDPIRVVCDWQQRFGAPPVTNVGAKFRMTWTVAVPGDYQGNESFRATGVGYDRFGSIVSTRVDLAIAFVLPVPGISGTAPAGRVGTVYSFVPTVSNAVGGAFRVVSGVLPPGLSVRPGTGEVFGTPTVAGTFPVSIEVSTGGGTAVAAFTFVIEPGPPMSSGALVGVAVPGTLSTFSHEWTWYGPNATPSFSAFYGLPRTLVVDEASLAFEYAADGVNFVTVTDDDYVLCVAQPGSFSCEWLAFFGAPPVTNAGAKFRTTWTAAVPGNYQGNDTIRATGVGFDRFGSQISTRVDLAIAFVLPVPGISGTAPAGREGTVYSFVPTVSNAVGGTFRVVSGALPPGLSLRPGTGEVFGTPTAAGTFPVSIEVSTGGGTAVAAFTFVIEPRIIEVVPTGELSISSDGYTVFIPGSDGYKAEAGVLAQDSREPAVGGFSVTASMTDLVGPNDSIARSSVVSGIEGYLLTTGTGSIAPASSAPFGAAPVPVVSVSGTTSRFTELAFRHVMSISQAVADRAAGGTYAAVVTYSVF